ncbi:hypothetical protein ACH492_00875 [Streptomyces sp. NPDC019443]|uniref:hypothetical protein n=1 Tax=Streptomyces sp. NPDC019443 TaxID=3365061 RepID=UPI0037A0289A
MELTLTPAGHEAAREVAGIEAGLRARIEAAAAGHDPDGVLAFLRTFVAGRSTGDAVARRAGREPAPGATASC